jgi:hypothetical protein
MSQIDPLQALATVGFGAIKSQTFPKASIGGRALPKNQLLAAQSRWRDSFIYGRFFMEMSLISKNSTLPVDARFAKTFPPA